MPNLPDLPVVELCPDAACHAAIGEKHDPGCSVAICVSTGHQRLLHNVGATLTTCVDLYPDQPTAGAPLCHLGCGIPIWRHAAHICGEDVWTGLPHGTAEAIAAGLLVYRSDEGWVPCDTGTDGAIPDLTRLTQTGTWNPITQLWEIATPAAERTGE